MSLKSVLKCILAFVSASACIAANPTIGPWIPKFKGIDLSVSTNFPGERFLVLQVVTALRVDLTDPDIRLLTTPRRENYSEGFQEVGGLTVSDFLRTNQLQAAINANFFDAGAYYLPPGYPMDLYGLEISEGVVVSQADASRVVSLLFDSGNVPTFVRMNWPAVDTQGVWTAVSGDLALVADGVNVVNTSHRLDRAPRTAFGISQDKRYLYLVGIDGRQSGYSEGSTGPETAEWMLLLGAYNALNLDGGGSTTVVMANSTGEPVEINHSSAVADSGRERTVGSHFGIYAKPLEGFFKNVTVHIEDTSAIVKWDTGAPAITKLVYGLTEDFGSEASAPENGTNHLVQLVNLSPGTRYLYQLVAEGEQSATFAFTTTNFVTTNAIFGLTNNWRFTSTPFANSEWTLPSFDDSAWDGSGPGLLWVNNRGANEEVQPANTELPLDPGTGYPYVTYYFRTHFTVSNLVAGSSLAVSGYVDDGLVLYLNGVEIWRLRVPVGADAGTVALGFPCSGNATCLESNNVPASLLSSLKGGDNVLAAEVHNYDVRSGDVTFGLAMDLFEPIAKTALLQIDSSGGQITVRWEASSFRLQGAESLSGTWTDIGVGSPAVISPGVGQRFFRLVK